LEANNSAANHEIPHILWNHMVHYHFYNSLPLVLILSQIKLASGFSSHFFNSHFSVFLFPSGLPTDTLCVFIDCPTRVPLAIPVPSSLI